MFTAHCVKADKLFTGGIISLGLAMTKFNATRMKEKFLELATNTFKYRREGYFGILDPLKVTSKALMLLRIYDSVYRTGPLKEGLRRLFGDVNLYSSARAQQHQRSTRVAVTSTKDTAANRCLITNYNRPGYNRSGFSGGEDFEREDDDEKEMKVWEAGLATAAAPFYFRPFEKPETMKNYVDGALHANLPIAYALEEMANVWPDLDAQTSLDALVSVGTGIQLREIEIPSVLQIGGFKEICTNFQNNINTERIWEKFINHPSLPTRVRRKIYRLNAHIKDTSIALDDWDKMGAMETMIAEQMCDSAGHPSPLSSYIAKVGDILTASLFYFEPDSSSLARPIFAGSTQNRRFELAGTIRCRLARQSQELRRLLYLVDSFWHREVCDETQIPDPNGWNQIDIPEDCRNAVRAAGAWFSVPCTISTFEPTDMLQVIAVTLIPPKEEADYYLKRPFPISGFPISFSDLQKKATSAKGVSSASY